MSDARLRSEVERIVRNGKGWAREYAYDVLTAALDAERFHAATPEPAGLCRCNCYGCRATHEEPDALSEPKP